MKLRLNFATLVANFTAILIRSRTNFLPPLIFVFLNLKALDSNAQIGITRVGSGALASNRVEGIYNTALGYYSLNANTTGNKNTASGANSLRSNTTGIFNTSSGYAALCHNISGSYNSAFGAYSLFTNKDGSGNTASGDESLYKNTFGGSNTANGYRCLYNNATGSNNTSTGYSSLLSNTSGHSNTANGAYALKYNTTGYYNVANGYYSLSSTTIGIGNAANGTFALQENTTGNYNAATGHQALLKNTTGKNNMANGAYALTTNITGSDNTAVGAYADVTTGNLNNATAIGRSAYVDASNKVRIGNNSVTSIGGQVSWTNFSDGRYKRNVRADVHGLDFINSLRPVTYTVDIEGLNAYYNNGRKEPDGAAEENIQSDQKEGEELASKLVHSGFVAQEVEEAARKLNYDFSGVDRPKKEGGLYGLRYSDFVVPLVKAVQELDVKTKEIDELRNALSELRQMVMEMKREGAHTGNLSTAYLEGSTPNPANNSTRIHYYIPPAVGSAQIVLTDMKGALVRTLTVVGKGNGQLNVNTAVLAAGTYTYTLYVDGRKANSKQLLIAR